MPLNVLYLIVPSYLEVREQLKHLNQSVRENINLSDVTALALNRLPTLYASTSRGWQQQRKRAYNEQVDLILNRTNKISKKKYINDPAIMAWELANEPRPMRPAAESDYKKWIADVSAMIKAKDKNHLVTLGHEGLMGTESLKLFEEIHADKNVDYLTIHIWAKNWGWFQGEKVAEGYQNVVEKASAYLNAHIAVAKKLDKPLVIEEFGLPRNAQSFDITSSTALRDDYYGKMFAFVAESAKTGGVLAGANFWAFGGTSRPTRGQIFWKKGDDYMGDPPMEEQGLNTVFDSDKTTWAIINKYSKLVMNDK